MERRPLRIIAFMLGAALFGFAMSSIPAPADVSTFWVGNFSSPWALLAFLAGWSQGRTAWAILTAIGAEMSCVAGFYGRFLFGSFHPDSLGLPRDTAPLAVASLALGHWLSFVAPWMVVGIGAGVVYGVLGAWWAHSRSFVAGALVAVPFIVEPLIWPIYVGRVQGPALVWIGEVVAGAAVLATVALAWRRAGAQRRAIRAIETA
jgi:hypothetical protein